MGKKSSNISSSSPSLKMEFDKKLQVRNLNRLIKNLRPKVYITDSSNFKTLVQTLTGNNNNDHDHNSSDDQLTTPTQATNDISIHTLEDFDYYYPSPSIDYSSPELVGLIPSANIPVNDNYNNLDCNYRDLESWLLETEDEQEQRSLCFGDYINFNCEFPGLMSAYNISGYDHHQ